MYYDLKIRFITALLLCRLLSFSFIPLYIRASSLSSPAVLTEKGQQFAEGNALRANDSLKEASMSLKPSHPTINQSDLSNTFPQLSQTLTVLGYRWQVFLLIISLGHDMRRDPYYLELTCHTLFRYVIRILITTYLALSIVQALCQCVFSPMKQNYTTSGFPNTKRIAALTASASPVVSC